MEVPLMTVLAVSPPIPAEMMELPGATICRAVGGSTERALSRLGRRGRHCCHAHCPNPPLTPAHVDTGADV